MAKQVMPPASLEKRATDLRLSDEQLFNLSLFAQVKKKPSLDRFPGTVIVRRYRKGDVICRQGDAAWTALYLLTTEDILGLRSLEEKNATDRFVKKVLEQEIVQLAQRVANFQAKPDNDELRRCATIRLTVARPAEPKPEGLVRRLTKRWFGGADVSTAQRPTSIAIDAPVEIDYDTMQAPLHEGELFGEMSCLYGTPRSGTVIADRDCYAIEMLRNILEQLQKDPGYKAKTDEGYRKRVFQLHLRKLSIFADLSEEEFAQVREQIELLTYDAGQVIYDEHERSDNLYLVRSGLVKVLKKSSALFHTQHVRNWPALAKALREGETQPDTPRGKVWKLLTPEARTAVQTYTEKTAWPEPARQEVLHALNQLLKDRQLPEGKEFQSVLAGPAFQERTRDFTGKRKDWPDQEIRHFNRVLLESVLPEGLRHYRKRVGPECVLFYCSRGEFIGEMGLVGRQPRTETIVAYGHSREGGAGKEAGRVELVRIPGKVFWSLLEASPAIRAKVDRKIAERRKQTQEQVRTPIWDDTRQVLLSERFEKLGLIQGQRLMLIDLDRCTRCDECVRACVATHDDGHSRLFLDGPRFGKFLVPVSCRSCLDPVCMIGCPVGSIHRGDNGQIAIEDWCIGCGLCANQCPYGSIHMHDIGLIAEDSLGWRYQRATSRDNFEWTKRKFNDRSWVVGRGPFTNDREFRDSLPALKKKESTAPAPTFASMKSMSFNLMDLGNPAAAEAAALEGQALCFRHHFRMTRPLMKEGNLFKLEVESKARGVRVWVNGQELQPQDKPKGGRHEFWLPPRPPATPPAPAAGAPATPPPAPANPLRLGDNVLAVQVTCGGSSGEALLKARLDEVRRPSLGEGADDVTQKLVTERAVVCDLCSSQLGQRPACVNACPHEAAMRVDARFDFPLPSSAAALQASPGSTMGAE